VIDAGQANAYFGVWANPAKVVRLHYGQGFPTYLPAILR
jgi:hypothetical protein